MEMCFRSLARRRASRIEMRSPLNSPTFALAAIGESVNSPFPSMVLFRITSMGVNLPRKAAHFRGRSWKRDFSRPKIADFVSYRNVRQRRIVNTPGSDRTTVQESERKAIHKVG